jgi:hypothetical protein
MKFDRDAVDYSLYLVTGRELLPEGKVGGFRAIATKTVLNFLAVAGLL